MKKIFLTTAVMFAALSMSAQLATVTSVDRVNTESAIEKPVISADGSFVVGYAPQAAAIVKIDAVSGATSTVMEGKNLYGLRLTGDNQSVVFTRANYDKKHMRKNSLEAVSLTGGKSQVLVKPTRKLNAGVSISGSTVAAVENGRVKVRTLGATASTPTPVASISYGHLQVTVDGETKTIDPQGRGSYLWPSVSPDGTKVVYWLVGKGCFVANLDGSDAKAMGNLRAATWAGNDMVVGMDMRSTTQEADNSAIVAKRISDGVRQQLTSDDVVALFPSASADGSRIAFTTPEGAVYIISLTK